MYKRNILPDPSQGNRYDKYHRGFIIFRSPVRSPEQLIVDSILELLLWWYYDDFVSCIAKELYT